MIEDFLKDGRCYAVAGHVNPDGDCIGSCTALYQYIKKCRPDAEVDLYLETMRPVFSYLKGCAEAKNGIEQGKSYDRLFLLDTSAEDRIGVSPELMKMAAETICIDHHISNTGFADRSIVRADASSASEVLYDLLDEKLIDQDIACSLYTGIIHDSGVFQYSCTGPHTMEVAAALMRKGVPFPSIIEDTFNSRTFSETKILGHVLDRSELHFDGACIFGCVTQEEMERFGISKQELDGIVSVMRQTEGVEVSVFLYPAGPDAVKVSFRSREWLDVSALAASFGGGGHVRAAGCTIPGSMEEAKEKVLQRTGEALRTTEN